MSDYKKFHIFVMLIFIIFAVFLFVSGYFSIGLISDDYLNFYDATHSTFLEKATGKLPFTNSYHIRPVYYLSIEKSFIMSKWLGFNDDNFTFYRIQNLVIMLLISYIAGRIILYLTGKFSLGLIASLSVIIFPNNLNNICWTAARVDLLCCLFFVAIIYFTYRYMVFEDIFSSTMIYVSYILALFTKETSLIIPFIVTLFMYFTNGKKILFKHKYYFISLYILLLFYIAYRFAVIGNNADEIFTLYQSNPFSNAPGVVARAVIGLSIPLDFLALSRMLKQDNKIIILYLASLYGAGFYLIWTMFKVDVYKYIAQIFILGFVLIIPNLIIGYLRPQMVLIPFVIILMFTLWIYFQHYRVNKSINKKILKFFYAVVSVFWVLWSYTVIADWEISYSKGLENINSLIGINLEQGKKNIVIGNPGRYKQTFIFDKLTGAYNFWKEKKFEIKDTINDVIQTGSLEPGSIGAKLEITRISSNEFEIKTTGKSQFFYIEGYNFERIKTGFRNDEIDAVFTEFNYLDKPIKLKLTILSNNVNCYLASELKFIKIY